MKRDTLKREFEIYGDDEEIDAIKICSEALSDLDDEQTKRVVSYLYDSHAVADD